MRKDMSMMMTDSEDHNEPDIVPASPSLPSIVNHLDVHLTSTAFATS